MPDIVEQIRGLRRALDVAALDQLYADDLLMHGVMGEPTYGKMAILDEVKRALVEHENAGRRTRYDAA